MTRAEAIEVLTASDYFWLRPSENEAEALNMAIAALEQLSLPRIIVRQGEQEPSEDYISRKRLRESLPYTGKWVREIRNCPKCGARKENDKK